MHLCLRRKGSKFLTCFSSCTLASIRKHHINVEKYLLILHGTSLKSGANVKHVACSCLYKGSLCHVLHGDDLTS